MPLLARALVLTLSGVGPTVAEQLAEALASEEECASAECSLSLRQLRGEPKPLALEAHSAEEPQQRHRHQLTEDQPWDWSNIFGGQSPSPDSTAQSHGLGVPSPSPDSTAQPSWGWDWTQGFGAPSPGPSTATQPSWGWNWTQGFGAPSPGPNTATQPSWGWDWTQGFGAPSPTPNSSGQPSWSWDWSKIFSGSANSTPDWHSYFSAPAGDTTVKPGTCKEFGCVDAFDMAHLSNACQCFVGCEATWFGNVCCSDYNSTCSSASTPKPTDTDAKQTVYKSAHCHGGAGAKTLGPARSVEKERCRQLCVKRRQCAGFTYAKNRSHCTLLSDIDIPDCEVDKGYLTVVFKMKPPHRRQGQQQQQSGER